MPEPPLVTVLMATFNDAAFLPDAVRSVLTQTFTEFEFLIIDDGSTDGTSRYLLGLTDPRVRVARNESNLGLTRSLKRGIELARGRFIARLDADDIALPSQARILGATVGVHDDDGQVGRLQVFQHAPADAAQSAQDDWLFHEPARRGCLVFVFADR